MNKFQDFFIAMKKKNRENANVHKFEKRKV